jgi:predicted dehydrogenase
MDQGRRRFLASAAGMTALSQSRILGANERIRVAGIGVGGRCRFLLGLVQKLDRADIVAVCDAYGPRRDEALQKLATPGGRAYLDYRELLDRKDVDAVFIGSPDHWHVPMAVDAVRAGKDVYVEKPVSHTIEEGTRLIQAVEETGRVLQVGYQQRSWDVFDMGREIVHSGKLGQVTMALSHWYQDYIRNFGRLSPVDVSQLDWKRFLGSAPDQAYDQRKFQQWRWYWDFGGGALTDLHSHWGDVIHWFMKSERPSAAAALGDKMYHKHWDCPDTINATWQYPGFNVNYSGTLVGHLEGGTLVFRGTDAMMRITRDGLAVYPEGVLAAERTNYPEPVITMRATHDGTIDHVRNFLDCVVSRKKPNADVRSAVASARSAHLGNLAYRKAQVLRSEGMW